MKEDMGRKLRLSQKSYDLGPLWRLGGWYSYTNWTLFPSIPTLTVTPFYNQNKRNLNFFKQKIITKFIIPSIITIIHLSMVVQSKV